MDAGAAELPPLVWSPCAGADVCLEPSLAGWRAGERLQCARAQSEHRLGDNDGWGSCFLLAACSPEGVTEFMGAVWRSSAQTCEHQKRTRSHGEQRIAGR